MILLLAGQSAQLNILVQIDNSADVKVNNVVDCSDWWVG